MREWKKFAFCVPSHMQADTLFADYLADTFSTKAVGNVREGIVPSDRSRVATDAPHVANPVN